MCTLGTVADKRASVGKKNMASSSGCAMTKIAVEMFVRENINWEMLPSLRICGGYGRGIMFM